MARRPRSLTVPTVDHHESRGDRSGEAHRPAELPRAENTRADGSRHSRRTAPGRRGSYPDLVALNRPDADAWRRVEQTVEPPPGDDDMLRLRWLLDADDPLTVVERAWRLSQLRGDRDGEHPTDPTWLWRRLPHDLVAALQACDREPLACLRALLEAAHWLSLRKGPGQPPGQPPEPERWLRAVDERFDEATRAHLAALAPRRHDALSALRVALGGDEKRSLRRLDAADTAFRHALATVPDGEPEIASRIHILASGLDFLRVDSDFKDAARHLHHAGRLLETAPNPLRAAEILLRLSRVMQHLKRPSDARRLLREAREDLAASDRLVGRRDDRLRLEIDHDLLQLAIAAGAHDEAERLLEESNRFGPYVVNDPGMVAERRRLQGRLALDREQLDEAATLLVVAITGLLDTGQLGTATLALHDLRSAWRHIPSGVALPPESWSKAAEIHHLFSRPIVQRHLTPTQRSIVEAFSRWLGLEPVALSTAPAAIH